MRLGILNGGGDCPGLNAVTRAVVRRAERLGSDVVGLLEGWRGLVENRTRPITPEDTFGILRIGGTILRTSRTNPFRSPETLEAALSNFAALGLDGLIAVGGEDTLGAAARLYREHQLPIVGVPKTIDNDLAGTDFTFGFDTAVSIATEAIDRLHTTAESHNRVILVEVMGRHAGWITTWAGIAGGADYLAIPERPTSVDAIAAHIRGRAAKGHFFSVVAVSEGAQVDGLDASSSNRTDEFGHVQLGGIAHALAPRIEKATGFDTRVTVLGHVQRGGTPTARDRVLATRYGVFACDLAHAKDWGQMAALHGDEIVSVPLEQAVQAPKTVPPELFALAETFFG